MELFYGAKNYQQLKELTVKFLKGELKETNSHYGPICEETYLIRSLLIIINELGCVTSSSQPGLIEEDYHQRAYVTMLIAKKKYDIFKKRIEKKMGKVHVKILSEDLIDDEILAEDIPDYWQRNRYWVSASFLSDEYFEGHTHLGITEGVNCYSFQDIDIYQELNANYYQIEVVDLNWGQKDLLFREIIKVLLDIK